jgi:hypothetical protein
LEIGRNVPAEVSAGEENFAIQVGLQFYRAFLDRGHDGISEIQHSTECCVAHLDVSWSRHSSAEVALEDLMIRVENVFADQKSCPRFLLQINLHSRAWNFVLCPELSRIPFGFRYRSIKINRNKADIFFCFANE